MGRYKPYKNVPFEDRTLGDLLDEFYSSVAMEIDSLSSQRADLTPDQLERLADLEEMMIVDERGSLRGLSDEESLAVWSTIHKTGDPLADYWEYRSAKGLSVDLDLEDVPPRSEWDKE